MRFATLVLVLAAFAAGSCGDTESLVPDGPPNPFDAWLGDGGMPDAPDAPLPAARPAGAAITSGGGVVSSTGHRLRVRIGAPQPMGRTSSTNHRLTMGPGAIPWGTP
jgi:hypothetical protein